MKEKKGGDKMDSKTLWAVVVTALIVAVLTSLITVKLTGNIVNLPTVYPSPTNYTTLYTKAEVDTLLRNLFLKPINITIEKLIGSTRSYKDYYGWTVNGNFSLNMTPGYISFNGSSEFGELGYAYLDHRTLRIVNDTRVQSSDRREAIITPGRIKVSEYENITTLHPEGVIFLMRNYTSPWQELVSYICSPDIYGNFGCKKWHSG